MLVALRCNWRNLGLEAARVTNMSYIVLQRRRFSNMILDLVISPARTPELLWRKHVGEDWYGEDLEDRAAQRTH